MDLAYCLPAPIFLWYCAYDDISQSDESSFIVTVLSTCHSLFLIRFLPWLPIAFHRWGWGVMERIQALEADRSRLEFLLHPHTKLCPGQIISISLHLEWSWPISKITLLGRSEDYIKSAHKACATYQQFYKDLFLPSSLRFLICQSRFSKSTSLASFSVCPLICPALQTHLFIFLW